MQISRHWRMNSRRYRLEGIRYEDNSAALEERTNTVVIKQEVETVETPQVKVKEPVVEAA